MTPSRLSRRRVIALAAALPMSGVAWAQRSYTAQVYRDPNCGCCLAWVEHVRATGRFQIEVIETADMNAVKQRLNVPAELASCHTTTIDAFVIEGHTPAADILRLLEQRPASVLGLAVAGMPSGSPGMDRADGRRAAYNVMAFANDGSSRVFATYPAI